MSTEFGKHDFIIPDDILNGPSPGMRHFCKTFSIGIFQWIGKSNGGLKRSRAKIRIKGLTENPMAVKEMAEKICNQLDAGEQIKMKVIDLTHNKLPA